MGMSAFDRAREALQTKPKGRATQTCTSCRGDGCGDCRGWGWKATPGYCLLPATGRECGDCARRKGCKR